MVVKIFSGFWFFTLLALLALFLYEYASMGEELLISDEQTGYTIQRDVFFYSFLTIIALANASVYVVRSRFASNQLMQAWYYGLIITINFFCMLSVYFITVYNSAEKYDFSNLGLVLYASMGLVGVWLTSWPIVVLWQRQKVKLSVPE